MSELFVWQGDRLTINPAAVDRKASRPNRRAYALVQGLRVMMRGNGPGSTRYTLPFDSEAEARAHAERWARRRFCMPVEHKEGG